MKSCNTPETPLTAARALPVILGGRLPQSILLTGERGSGKHTLALEVACALLCTGPEPRPCLRCNACHKAREGIHPDLTVTETEGDTAKVDFVRALRTEVLVVPNDGDRRVTVLHGAHRLNPAAQNALLKTLEEPPAFAFFILTSDQPDALLPTIRSRCTRYQLAPPEASTPDAALAALLPPFLAALARADEAALLRAAMAMEKLDRTGQRAFLSVLETALRDAVFAAEGLPGRLLPDLTNDTAALGCAVSPDRLLRVSALLHTLSDRLLVNASAAATSSALCAGAYTLCHGQREPFRRTI